MVANPLTARIDAGRDAYGIKLEIFEGPLDLLLFLIRKDEIDVYDIPIAAIAKQYLEYVELMQQLNLEQAGDFLVMAATLMKIKSRMLLPAEGGDDEEAEDPRDELVRRLLEYQQTKEVASWMEDRQERFRDVFYRGAALESDEEDEAPEEDLGAWREVGLFDLIAAFKDAMDAASQVRVHHVEPIEVTTEERVALILDILERRGRASFVELCTGLPRMTLVVTFVALLEMVKGGQLAARQAAEGGDIWLYPAASAPAFAPAVEEAAPTQELTGEEARQMREALGLAPARPKPWERGEGGQKPEVESVSDPGPIQVRVTGDEPGRLTGSPTAWGDEPHSAAAEGGVRHV